LYKLDDPCLIEWLKKNHKEIVFTRALPYEIHGRAEKLVNNIGKLDSKKELYEQKGTVTEIWRALLGKAIVYLKFKDDREKHHDDEDYGVDKLEDFFTTFDDFEPLLYGAEEEHYRDHMAHMLSVFLIGELLIKDTIGFDKIDAGDKKFPNSNKICPEEKEAMWCIMSLTHDLGIALERIVAISPKCRDMLVKYGVINVQELAYPFFPLPLHDFMIKFISSDLEPLAGKGEKRYNTHIHAKYFLKFSEAYEKRDHGIISCLVLMKNLVYFLESDYLLDLQKPLNSEEAKQFLIRRNILRTIAAHSNENIYYLTLPQFPFLLSIFDELHEWGRPKLVEMFQREKLKKTVVVKELTYASIYYEVVFKSSSRTLAPEDVCRVRKEIFRFFKRRCEKIRRILRSAVGGEDRNLKLTFEVSDQLEPEAISYKIIHETPEKVKYFEDKHEITWLQLSEKLEELK